MGLLENITIIIIISIIITTANFYLVIIIVCGCKDIQICAWKEFDAER